ncbi:hypothetical protein C6A85_72465, partial [Mycobacterium sp. ITM-2017-0098]
AIVRQLEKERQLEAEQEADRKFELTRRAERQRRWTLIGDERAIHGQDGAAARRRVAEDDDEAAQDDSPIAQLATTTAELDALIRDQPQAWPQALFASILVQRLDPLLPR